MENLIVKIIKHPEKIIYGFSKIGLLNWMSDERYLKIIYKLVFKKNLDLENPKTFNEKLQWLKLNEHNPYYTEIVDKYEVKEIVKNIIGEEYIIPTLGIYNNFDEINFEDLPEQFVLKCTHDSGGISICSDKTKYNKDKVKKEIQNRMKKNFYYRFREWPYKNVKPRIIIEKYLSDNDKNNSLNDYKFMCFNGKVKLCLVCSDRFNGLKETFFDEEWNILDLKRINHEIDDSIKKPKNFEQMKILAEKLSKNFKFLRVDFYEVNEKIYFGELTLYPAGGMEKFQPQKWDEILGEYLNI